MLSSVIRSSCRSGVRAFASFMDLDPFRISKENPVKLYNLVGGRWKVSKSYIDIPDPMNGDPIIKMPNTKVEELDEFFESAASCPKSGMHNPLKNPERYLMYGEVCHKAAAMLEKPEVADFFAKAIMRVMPKSYPQAAGEVKVTKQFLKNFAGDNVRFAACGQHTAGDHQGQMANGYRWPFGPVAIVSPFNFPLEIPVLQLMGSLFMGNKPTIKAASTVSYVLEMFIRMLIEDCGLPASEIDLLHCGGRVVGELIAEGPFRVSQFTGSSGVSEQLASSTRGKVRVEDAGFDWKILGPDVQEFDYVAWQCDQDAYACTGQKCSAQSILFMHENWAEAGIEERLKEHASKRNLADLTVGPVLSVSTKEMLDHTDKLLAIPGARVCWGGKELKNHTIPEIYGAMEPTAVFVPLDEMLKPENFELCVTEIFGPYQVVTEYKEGEVDKVLEALERMSHHLTAGVVSNDPIFTNHILANTVNGTTYSGIRARTTGAPQNHWFGPAGDPRGAGIGTTDAIRLVWSCHREIVTDIGPVPAEFEPKCT
eukprot:TRINITY_DN776130_c0_g1_i1.p1 TRINITY_DN776130_c0_g1~~TRINITY_DN776130_c0_g1_i1.p1  ORF type:complete len:546 (+),score=183.75 TRINITY_DN776130_c0_g1_i1:23-1639(+)